MDYYDILGVKKDATQDDISKAYRQKAMRYHPDVSKEEGASEKFKEIAEAYEVLNDPQKRDQYDRYGTVGAAGPSAGGFDPFEIFNRMRRGHGRSRKRGRDRLVEAELSFEEAVAGCNKDIKVTYKDACEKCKGTGVKTWKNCETCQGRGRQTIQQSPFILEVGCTACGGHGRMPDEKCAECNGDGLKKAREETVTVKIPAGVDTGMQVRLLGLGDFDSTNSVRGDLYVTLKIQPHEFFTREGVDLWCRVYVPYTKLVLGTKLDVPTLDKVVEVKIPPNTSPGTKLRLKGHGLPDIHRPNRLGDIMIIVDLDMPKAKGDYKKKLRELSTLEDEFLSPQREEFNNYVERIRR